MRSLGFICKAALRDAQDQEKQLWSVVHESRSSLVDISLNSARGSMDASKIWNGISPLTVAGQTPFGRRARAKSEDTVAEDLAQLSGHRSRLSVSHVTAGHTDHGKGRFTGKMIDVDIDT